MSRCGICHHDRGKAVLDTVDGGGQAQRLVRCAVCALVQVEHPPGRQELLRYYAKYCYESEDSWVLSAATQASIARVADRLEPYRSSDRVLDVGSGAGAFLSVFAARGWSVEGTELSDAAAVRLRSGGFTIHCGELEQLDLAPGTYDVIIMSELLEHLLDPRGVLSAALRLLRPGGALYLTTPNFGSLSRRVLGKRWRVISPPEHLSYFTEESAGRLLKACSYRLCEVWTDGLNPYELWAVRTQGNGDSSAALQGAKAASEELRLATLRSPARSALKSAVNRMLRAFGLGDTLKALAERPVAEQ
jgi:2-polyprenyl-3-methyl-5-hydroxy-6-metoxy-1,4-benzoquinol methylase